MTAARRKRLQGTGRGWVYKVNASGAENARAWGDWDDFFDDNVQSSWGGSWASGNAESLNNFGDVRRGDRIWAYQTRSPRPGRSRRLVGVAEVVRVEPSTVLPGETDLILKPLERFEPGIAIHEVKLQVGTLKNASAFKAGHAGTLYALEPREHKALVDVALRS
jgi:hypothetical protein